MDAQAKTQTALTKLQTEQRQRIGQAFQTGWRTLAGLNERSADETYEACGTIEGIGGVRRICCEMANVVSRQALATLSGLRVVTGETGGHGDAPTGAYDQRVAMAFWMRRQLDGTHRAFFDILRQTMGSYGALPPGELPALDDR